MDESKSVTFRFMPGDQGFVVERRTAEVPCCTLGTIEADGHRLVCAVCLGDGTKFQSANVPVPVTVTAARVQRNGRITYEVNIMGEVHDDVYTDLEMFLDEEAAKRHAATLPLD